MFSFRDLLDEIRFLPQRERIAELTYALERALSDEDFEKFDYESSLWGSRTYWKKAEEFIRLHIPQDPENHNALYVYAVLYDTTINKIDERWKNSQKK